MDRKVQTRQQMLAQFLFIRPLLMFSVIQSMLQTVLALQMQETFMDVLQTLLRMFLKNELQLSKVEVQPLPLLLVQQQLPIQSKLLQQTAVTL